MESPVTDLYQRAHDEAVAKGVTMPNWMLRRSAAHAVRLALTNPYTASRTMQDSAWGAADGFADEILRRRALYDNEAASED